MILGFGGSLKRVVITKVVENTYYAELLIQRGSDVISIDARPSDSIAIALRMDAAIYTTDELLAHSAVEISDTGEGASGIIPEADPDHAQLARPLARGTARLPAPHESGRLRALQSVKHVVLLVLAVLAGTADRLPAQQQRTLKGRLIADGQPVANHPVALHRVTDAEGRILSIDTTAADGTFELVLDTAGRPDSTLPAPATRVSSTLANFSVRPRLQTTCCV